MAVTSTGKVWTKEAAISRLHWTRQIIAVCVGLICGILPITGWLGFVSFFTFTLAITHMYVFVYLGVPDNVFGEQGTAHEGLMQAMGVFLLTWITVYTVVWGST
jgi:hypothetical protein